MVHLQEMHESHEEDGLVVLGFNCADDSKIAEELLQANGVTYPNVLDSSQEARQVAFHGYHGSGVPLNYVIDREGRVAAAFYGYRENDRRLGRILRKLGIE